MITNSTKPETTTKTVTKTMKVKTNLKAGLFDVFRRPKNNHNQTLVRDNGAGLKVKTRVKAGRNLKFSY